MRPKSQGAVAGREHARHVEPDQDDVPELPCSAALPAYADRRRQIMQTNKGEIAAQVACPQCGYRRRKFELCLDGHGRLKAAALRFSRIVLAGGGVTEPGDEMAAGAAGAGCLRASDADRERVIDVLKVAFVQNRLTKDDFDARVGQAFASRTYAELAAATADIPAAPTGAQPPRHPFRPRARQPVNPDLKGDFRVLVTAYPIAVVLWLAAVLVSGNPAGMPVPLLACIATIAALHSSLHGAMVLAEPWLQRRFGWQLSPPPPEPGEWLFSVKRDDRVHASSGTAAHLADQVIMSEAMLHPPRRELIDVNWIGQNPRRLFGQLCMSHVIEEVDYVPPAVLHGDHQAPVSA